MIIRITQYVRGDVQRAIVNSSWQSVVDINVQRSLVLT